MSLIIAREVEPSLLGLLLVRHGGPHTTLVSLSLQKFNFLIIIHHARYLGAPTRGQGWGAEMARRSLSESRQIADCDNRAARVGGKWEKKDHCS
jgi:hypothetical protein